MQWIHHKTGAAVIEQNACLRIQQATAEGMKYLIYERNLSEVYSENKSKIQDLNNNIFFDNWNIKLQIHSLIKYVLPNDDIEDFWHCCDISYTL